MSHVCHTLLCLQVPSGVYAICKVLQKEVGPTFSPHTDGSVFGSRVVLKRWDRMWEIQSKIKMCECSLCDTLFTHDVEY